MTQKSINPHNNELLGEYPTHTSSEIDQILDRSQLAQGKWKKENIKTRSDLLLKFSKVLSDNKQGIAELISLEMGKPIKESFAEIDKSIWCIEYYAERASGLLSIERIDTEAFRTYVTKEPLGVILGVMPWNFPLWQVIRFAIPTLLAGNSIVVKHASNIPQFSQFLELLFTRSEFPEDLYLNVLTDRVGVEQMLHNHYIKGVSVTGGTKAGSAIGSIAGSVQKKSVMELGGSDPFIVFPDADIRKAAEVAVRSRMINNGQSCIAAKRFLIQEKAYQRFLDAFLDELNRLKVGDPLKEDTDLGPLATASILESIDLQIQQSIKMGGRVVIGSTRIEKPGNYYSPTVIVDVTPDMPVMGEETFGPVAAIQTFSQDYEAIQIANDTEYGLGASIWTKDHERAEQLIPQIEAGNVFINQMVRSDPRLPFGGVKRSGYGRELGSFGIHEFVNLKSVWIE